jgi:anti-sigma B factor antagonist
MSMNYAVRQMGDVIVLDLSGRISPGESIAHRLVLQDLVREQLNTGHNKILLNLGNVTYINSSGIAGLLASWRDVTDRGGELRVCDAANRVGDILRRTNLDSVLNLDNDEPTALQGFSGHAQKKTSAA